MKSFTGKWSVALLSLLALSTTAHPTGHAHDSLHSKKDIMSYSSSSASEHHSDAASGYRSVMYFTNWGIYGRNYQPQNMSTIASSITHVLYSFANVNSQTGEVVLSDTYADLQKHYPTDSWNDQGNNVYGCVKQLYLLKKANRNMKVLLSVGGWTYSSNFAGPMATDSGRATFVSSAVKLVEDLGFDGIDIDWEYPSSGSEAGNFVSLLSALRTALDASAGQRGDGTKFYITAAVAAGPSNYQNYQASAMNQYLDFWNLMAYDYAGSWAQPAGHQANLYKDNSNPGATPFNTDQAISWYTSNGVDANKITLGMPLYGRAFESTAGPGQSYNGVGSGSWENGIWDYKVLPKAGATENNDAQIGASWSYDSNAQEMISYDTPTMSQVKASYVQSNGLGGGMWWEASGDKPKGEGSLVDTFVTAVGGAGALEQAQNCLSYPYSQYDNMKAGMPS